MGIPPEFFISPWYSTYIYIIKEGFLRWRMSYLNVSMTSLMYTQALFVFFWIKILVAMGDHNSIIKSAAHEYKVALYYGHWEALAWIRLTHGNDCHVIVIVVHGTSQTVSRQPPYTNTCNFYLCIYIKIKWLNIHPS